ncbi:probable methyltransferase PMT9 [Magnolia sinica]|uniref:probable methyltransferase PMT9 n=1 Tax=Magnolia sinica TaxID=86752 RepID=UPI0026596B1D|nr:probable methyltransferase PMT9 [Magnolia sinica]
MKEMRHYKSEPLLLRRKVFSSILIAFVVSLGLICVYYGTTFSLPLRLSDADDANDPSFLTFSSSASLSDNDDDDDLDGKRNGSAFDSFEDQLHHISDPPKTIPVCDSRLSELIPCLDRNIIYQLKLKLNLSLMEHYERHCPPQEHRYNCLIPPPIGYKVPIRWPASRDEVWKVNVPHTHLASEKSDQNWMVVNGDKINFPGGGTHFHTGANKYVTALAKMLKFSNDNLNNGGNIRNVLDVGCGVASFGAHLLSLNIIAMSLAPNDVHENQIQFALERGIPSTLGVLGTMRLPYPSRSFELVHCSRCRIDWLQRDGILLLELDRLLRPGGYFVYSSPEAYAQDPKNRRIWSALSDLLGRMCWRIASKRDQTVIWTKPSCNSCYLKRDPRTQPPLCSSGEDPDAAWSVPMKACITPYSKMMHRTKGSGLVPWPQRLTTPPPRLEELGINVEIYREDTEIWHWRVIEYWKQMKSKIEKNSFRNIMDMNSNLGSFAASLKDKDVWVMNVVPVNESSKLKIIYDRGLIGTVHDWCESFSTYPRTYDLLHAWSVFSEIEKRGCSIEDLLVEMDRMLRPNGFVILRDKYYVINYIRKFMMALHWDGWSSEVEPKVDALSLGEERVLIARKRLWEEGEAKTL